MDCRAVSPPQLRSSNRTELMPAAKPQSHFLLADLPQHHSSSAAPGRGLSPAEELKAHPKALQVEKLRHRQVQRLACIT